MLQSLNGLRAIFAIAILVHHTTVDGSSIFPAGGALAVSFFFILSGFVTCLNMTSVSVAGVKRFMKSRVLAIYPLHWLALLVAIPVALMEGKEFVLSHFASNALLLQAWSPLEAVHFSFNSLSWFLSSLLFCYILAPFIVAVSQRWKPLLWIIAAIVSATVFYVARHVPEADAYYVIYLSPLTRVADFIIGMATAKTYMEIDRSETARSKFFRRLFPVMEILALAIVILAIIRYPQVSGRYTLASYWWIPVSLFVLATALCDKKRCGPLRHLWQSRPMLWIGGLSLSLYLFHQLCYRVITPLCEKYSVPALVSIAIALAVSLIVAIAADRITRLIHRR